MKLFDFFSKKLSSKSLNCLEIFASGSEKKYVFQSYVIEQQRLSVLFTHVVSELNELAINNFRALPTIIVFTGDQIISKGIQISEGEPDLAKIFSATFPSISQKDFTHQFWPVENGRGYLSIIRGEYLEKEISNLRMLLPNVAQIFLGNACIFSLQSLVPEGTAVDFPSGKVIFGRNLELSSNKAGQGPFDSASQVIGIAAEQLIVFGGAMAHVIGYRPENSSDSILAEIESEADDKRKFSRFSIAAVVVMLFVTVTNAIVFQYYFRKAEATRTELNALKLKEAQFVQAAKKYGITTSVSGETTLLDTHFGYYSDRIANTIPDGIRLSELNINPENDDRGGRVTIRKEIRIAGTCENSSQLSRWIAELQKLKFLRSVNLNKFRMTGPGTSGFELTLLPIVQ
jgi:hypothetical protein